MRWVKFEETVEEQGNRSDYKYFLSYLFTELTYVRSYVYNIFLHNVQKLEVLPYGARP
jgi:hypothetical protein